MRQLKVSASYWNGLSANEQMIFADLANRNGSVQYAKRILALAQKHFSNFGDIAPLTHYVADELKMFASGVFVVFDTNKKKVGTIYKGYGFGVTERVSRYIDNHLQEVWHN